MSLVGHEWDYIDRRGYMDPKAGKMILDPLPENPKNIYMWWSYKKHRCKNGRIEVYKYLNFSKGGVKETYYCHGWKHYPDAFYDAHMDDFLYKFAFLCGNIANYWHPRKYKKLKRRNGRPRAMGKDVYGILNAAGFGTKGSRVIVKYKKYLTLEASAFRFSLLSQQDQQVIGSPDKLLDLCRKGYSLLKSRNRKSIPTTYEECFRDTAVEELGLRVA